MVTASPYDEPLSSLSENTENLAAWIGIWERRKEPDALLARARDDEAGPRRRSR